MWSQSGKAHIVIDYQDTQCDTANCPLQCDTRLVKKGVYSEPIGREQGADGQTAFVRKCAHE